MFLGSTIGIKIMKSNSFFWHTVHFKSSNLNWYKDYWDHPEYRLTFLLRKEFGNSFWENYSKNLVATFKSADLLFRAKWGDGETGIFFSQVWKSKESFDAYKNRAGIASNLRGALNRSASIELEESFKHLSREQIQSEIERIKSNKHIIQFINDKMFFYEGPVGDPLKKVVTPYLKVGIEFYDQFFAGHIALPQLSFDSAISQAVYGWKRLHYPGAKIARLRHWSGFKSPLNASINKYHEQWISDWSDESKNLFYLDLEPFASYFHSKNDSTQMSLIIPNYKENYAMQILQADFKCATYYVDGKPSIVNSKFSLILQNRTNSNLGFLISDINLNQKNEIPRFEVL